MFSKAVLCFKSILLWMLLCSILFLNSCSNEAISKNKGFDVNLAYDTKCFDGFSSRLSDWSHGLGDERKIEKDMNCISDGIAYFLLRVQGQDNGKYTSEDLFTFTEIFFKDTKIKKTLIKDLLVVKSWILGGSEQEITFQELSKISWFIRSSVPNLRELTPYAQNLFFKKSKTPLVDTDAIKIKLAIGQLSKNLLSLSESAESRVTKDAFETKINQILLDLKYDPISKQDLQSFWTLISLALGLNDQSGLSLNPSLGLYEVLSKVYFIAIRFKYGVLDHGWRNPSSYIHLDSVVNETLVLLKNLVIRQEQNEFTKNKLNQLFMAGSNFLNVDFEIKTDWVDFILQLILARFFESKSFGLNEIQILLKEWNLFNEFYSETLVLQGLSFSGSLTYGQNFVSLSELNQRTLSFKWPMLSNSQGYVLNSLKPKEIFVDYGNLFWINWQRALATVFLKMYSEDGGRKQKLIGVTIQELEKGYADIFKILKDIDYFSDKDSRGWFRIFNEANLFVPRANPDLYLGFEEGVDYFSLLFSGLSFSGQMYKSMSLDCLPETKDCQISWFKNSPFSFWQDFTPDFHSYLNTVDEEEWTGFIEGFEQMARETIQPEPFKRSELLRVSVATAYIEIFLRRYDSNHDLKIDFQETVKSFDNFKTALLSLPQVKGTQAEEDPKTLLAFYTFFLRRGRLPKKSFGQYIELLGWLKKVENCVDQTPEGNFIPKADVRGCEYQSSRGNLMKILAFLSNSI